MQSSNRVFDDLARMANGALSAAVGARQEMEQALHQRFERFLNDRGWVTREEFEAVRDMAQKAREEQEAIAARLAALETKLAETIPAETKLAKTKKPARKASASAGKTTARAKITARAKTTDRDE